MVWALVVARLALALDRIPGVGLCAVFVFLDLGVVAEIVEFHVAVDN
jgi:hypothetical protein